MHNVSYQENNKIYLFTTQLTVCFTIVENICLFVNSNSLRFLHIRKKNKTNKIDVCKKETFSFKF